jgi:hypothetical protein
MEVDKSTILKPINNEYINVTSNNFSTIELKNIKNIIGKLENYQLIEIIKIIDKYKYKYTQNNNGIFIDMTKLDNQILDGINTYLNFINKI